MTAKEQAEQAWMKYANNIYAFSFGDFHAFCNQLCREQRHECQTEMDKRSVLIDSVWYVACEDVLNASMPDL